MVWRLPFVKVRTVLKFSDSQLLYEQKKKVILCRNGWENSVWSESIKISFCYCYKAVTFSILSRFLAYLGQFKSKSHIQGHPQKVENQSFHLTPSLMEFQTILLDILTLKRGARFVDRTCMFRTLLFMIWTTFGKHSFWLNWLLTEKQQIFWMDWLLERLVSF